MSNDLFFGGMRSPFEQRYSRQNHSGGAVSALKGFYVEKRLLHRMQPIAPCKTLDSRNLFAVGRTHFHPAGTHGGSFDKDGAGATLAFAAAVLRASEFEVIAEDVKQAFVRRHFRYPFHAIDKQTESHRVLRKILSQYALRGAVFVFRIRN